MKRRTPEQIEQDANDSLDRIMIKMRGLVHCREALLPFTKMSYPPDRMVWDDCVAWAKQAIAESRDSA